MELLPASLSHGGAALFVIASFFTSALTASFGLGGGVLMLAILGTSLPVASLVPVHGLVQLGSNSGRAWIQRAHVQWSVLAPLLAGAVLGAFAGAMTIVQLPDRPLKLALGLFILAITWLKLPSFGRPGRAGFGVAGAAVAFLSMVFGATGPLLIAFIEKALPGRLQLVATGAAGNILIHGMKVAAFALAGFAFAPWLPLIAAMIASGYLGTVFGTKLLHRIPEARFRLGFKLLLSALALDLARQGMFGV